jgi:hypothetical protein
LVPASHIGWRADRTTGGSICTVASGDECQRSAPTSAAGGFNYPDSVAVDPRTGHVYVAEITNDRVQQLTATGAFVSMFGLDVNRATAGQMDSPESIAVNPLTGAAYVLLLGPGGFHLERFTREGKFVWRVDALKFANQSGDLLAVGGPEKLVYVGDEHRVQVFGVDGSWKREIPLASLSAAPQSSVVALALAPSGELYLVYRAGAAESYLPSERANVVRKFNPRGEQVAEYTVAARSAGALDSIDGMALDRSGELAVIGVEAGAGASARFGLLLNARTGTPIGEFTPPIDNDGIAFGDGALYVTTAVDQEVVVYAPAPPVGTLTSRFPCEAFAACYSIMPSSS